MKKNTLHTQSWGYGKAMAGRLLYIRLYMHSECSECDSVMHDMVIWFCIESTHCCIKPLLMTIIIAVESLEY